MLAPVLSHIANTSAQQPAAELRSASGEESNALMTSTRERRPPEPSTSSGQTTRPKHRAPFAAELEVIDQRARSSGPSRRNAALETDSGRRENRETERETQHTLGYRDESRQNNYGVHANTLPEVQRAKLATFDGNEDWESFLMPFERQARKYGWSAMERVDRLHECLRGAAVRYVCSLPERTREDYVLLVEQLTQRFGKIDPPTTIRRKLGELRQGRETSAEFAEEVRRLITLAYPGVDLQLQDQLATDVFLKGLRNQKVAYEVMNRDPGSLVEAQKFVEAHEHNFKATVGRDPEIKNRARRVSWVDEEDTCEDVSTMSRRIQTPQYVTVDQFTALMDQMKALVNKVDHLQLQVENLSSTTTGLQQPKASQQPISGIKPNYQLLQSNRGRSQTPSPNRGSAGPCFRCGEAGHFRKDCVRPSSPARNHGDKHQDFQVQSGDSSVVDDDFQLQGRQIGCTKRRGESLQIPLTVNGIPTQAVADTGAQTTVISEELYQRILENNTTPVDLPQTYLLSAGVGDGMEAKHGLTVTFKIGSKSIAWEVHVASIRDCVLLGLDLMKAHDVVIYTRGKVFIGGELVPSKIVRDDVPVRVCNFSTEKTALPRGVCLGVLIEACPEIHHRPKQDAGEDAPSLVVGRVATIPEIPRHLQNLVAATSEALSEDQQQRFTQILLTYQSIFAKNDSELGYLSAVTHKIDTGLARPVRQPVRRTPLGFQGEEEKHLKAMLEAGVITASASEWASPVVLVRKKDGGVRWCVDYRALNNLTVKDAYPLPQIEECLDVVGGATMFSTLDLQSGYWQISVDSKDREKTAFITKWGLYEYTRMPFGLCNAPSTFQRAMEYVLRGLQWETLLIYLDDVIIIGNGVEQSLDRLEQVFQRFQSHGLKLKPSKCHLLQEEVLFLGHVVSGGGVRPNPALIKDVQQWNPPNNVKELQVFLGLCNYYRKFVPNFAELASPLHNLLKKETVFLWTDKHQFAFTLLKQRLTTAPVLGYPHPDGKFILDTDASSNSVGAVLSQIQSGKERVLTYASSHLSPAQQRYCVTRRELLAVVRFTRQFRHYLLGRKFLLRTDHGSLTWLFRFKCPEGQLARWLEELSQYDFHIEHRAGKRHANADAMSRLPREEVDNCDCYQAGTNLSDLPCKGCVYCQRIHKQWAKFEEDVDYVVPLAVRCIEPQSDTISQEASIEDQLSETSPVANWLESFTPEQLAALQKADPVLNILYNWKQTGTLPSKDEVMLECPAVRKFWLCWPQVTLRQGVLHYSWERIGEQQPAYLLLVPASMQKEILQFCHNPPYSGHLGEAKTLERVRQNYHWYGLSGDVHLFVKRCPHCSACKNAGPANRAKIQSYQCGAPLDRLHLDILGPFPVSNSGNRYILVIIDQFTRWVEAFPVPDQGAETTAKKLVYEFIARFGAPLELHTDQGRNFESALFQNVCRLLQITKTRSTPYHPSSNGQVERFNRTLLQMLRCYVNQSQKNWDEHLPLLAAAYRSSRHSVTGYTPNRLMLGRETHQPQDIQSGTAKLNTGPMEVSDFLYNLEEGLNEVHSLAREHLRTAQARQKKMHDLRAKEHSYNVGDLVFLKDDTKKKGMSPKLQPIWKGPLIVAARRGPVLYEIQGPKRSIIIHHDRLKPYNSDVIPVWVSRQRSILLQRQDTDNQMSEEDVPLVPEILMQDNSNKAAEDSSELSKGSCDASTPSDPACQMTRRGDIDSLEKTVRTSSGRVVNRPKRFKY
ncbi:uncharacterized protein LOC130915330 [Corythoichthys intestinalis]|uniref:uncharacterized protein LOC130915330 n=1 Tax=Corythoichthys intestinalis TaxID=161448 RepID=UPI0025A4FFE5|nr:uncharacterized protein LOC130915330 [Corythoichthys intestinalis]